MRIALLRGVLALYTGLLVMPIPWLFVPGTGQAGQILGFVVGGTAALVATEYEDPVAPLSSWTVLAVVVLVPLGYLVPLFDLLTRVGLVGVTFPPGLAVGAAIPGLIAGLLADEIHQQRRIEAAAVAVTVSVRLAANSRRLLVAAIVAVGMLGLTLAAVAAVLFGRPLAGAGTVAITVFAVGVLLFEASRSRSMAITEAGLVVQETLFEWAEFDAVEVEDEYLVCRRPAWWEPDLTYEVGEGTDTSDVRAALERFGPTT